MKTYTFEAFVKDEKSAIEFAKEFLTDLKETPSLFKFAVKKIKFNHFKIKAERIKE